MSFKQDEHRVPRGLVLSRNFPDVFQIPNETMTYIGGDLREEEGGRKRIGLVSICTYKDILGLRLLPILDCNASEAVLDLPNET